MAGLGPFERPVRLAVAVSGGPDSMALCLLADAWARRQGGRTVALTVDHGLRPAAGAEAAAVGSAMQARGIEHHVLRWEGAKPRSAVQARARAARYALLAGWCRRHGVIHLTVAHQREDQAETFLMRLTRGSHADGLSAMSAVNETDGIRILRPLLAVERARLTATLELRGERWIEDPSNRDAAFTRVRVRQWLPALAGVGCDAARLADLATGFAGRRAERERAVANLLARACEVFPAGHAVLDATELAEAPTETATAALSRLLQTVGGSAYPPSRDKVARLREWLADDGAPASATLGRCRCLRRGAMILVLRECRGLPAPFEPAAGQSMLWDGRFAIAMGGRLGVRPILGPLGRDGWGEVVAVEPDLRFSGIPHPARLGLPALRDAEGVAEVPLLGFRRASVQGYPSVFKKIKFSPVNSLSGVGFCLASGLSSTI